MSKADFYHEHPYDIFIPEGTRKIIVGTLPPPRFTLKKLQARDVDFCYGSCDGMLWPVLNSIFNLQLRFDNSYKAVEERKDFLKEKRLGICDIVASCRRQKIDASDIGMSDITLRDLLAQLSKHHELNTIIFTGGNSKNGPEYLFRKQLKENGVRLQCTREEVPRRHFFVYKSKRITTISLTSPSNAANRAIGSTSHYKKQKAKNPHYTTFDYRVEQYRKVFT